MKKVLILSTYNPYTGYCGTRKYCLKIINSFKEQVDFDIKYILKDHDNPKNIFKKVIILYKYLFFKFKILFLCLKNKYDYIVVNSNFSLFSK